MVLQLEISVQFQSDDYLIFSCSGSKWKPYEQNDPPLTLILLKTSIVIKLSFQAFVRNIFVHYFISTINQYKQQ